MKKTNFVIILLVLLIGLLSGCTESEELEDTTTSYDVWLSIMEYVTPNHPSIVNITYEILGDCADGNLTMGDVTKVQKWLNKNIEYKMVDGVCFPNELLEARMGDCADISLLEYSILSYENSNNAEIYLVYVDLVTHEIDVIHACILVVFDDVLFLSDPTYRDYNSDIGNTFKPTTNISEIINELFKWTNIERYDIQGVFSDCCFSSFEDNDEFYGWCEYQLRE